MCATMSSHGYSVGNAFLLRMSKVMLELRQPNRQLKTKQSQRLLERLFAQLRFLLIKQRRTTEAIIQPLSTGPIVTVLVLHTQAIYIDQYSVVFFLPPEAAISIFQILSKQRIAL